MSAGPPGNGEARAVGNHPTSRGPVNQNETTKSNRSATISAGVELGNHYEECPELTEESLSRIEQGIWELLWEMVSLRSRIDTAISRMESDCSSLALSNNKGEDANGS
jgi:hypothetical protein